VNIIFNSAATIKFDETVKLAVQMNVGGVKSILDLAKEMKHLEALVHVSTAYVNFVDNYSREEPFRADIEPARLLKMAESMDTKLMHSLTKSLIKNKPNTYIFTKGVAEALINEECKENQKIPTAIIRPSIIGASWREPFTGWIDSFFGPVIGFTLGGVGLFRTMMGDNNCACDVIPVDSVVNSIIAAGWQVGSTGRTDLPVVNMTSGQINRFTWGMLAEYANLSYYKTPFENIQFVPSFRYTTNKLSNAVHTYALQMMPAYVGDLVLKLLKQKPMYLKVQSKIKAFCTVIEPFTQREWTFQNDQLCALRDKINESPLDKQKFNVDIRELNWKNYSLDFSLGSKIYVMKQDIARLPLCFKRLKRVNQIKNLVLTTLFVILLQYFMFNTEMGQECIDHLLTYTLILQEYLLNMTLTNSPNDPLTFGRTGADVGGDAGKVENRLKE
jgi:fatty acyl-CoA reductase